MITPALMIEYHRLFLPFYLFINGIKSMFSFGPGLWRSPSVLWGFSTVSVQVCGVSSRRCTVSHGDGTTCVCPFYRWWEFGVFPVSGSREQHRSKCSVTCLLVSLVHVFVGRVSSSGIAGPSDLHMCLALVDNGQIVWRGGPAVSHPHRRYIPRCHNACDRYSFSF